MQTPGQEIKVTLTCFGMAPHDRLGLRCRQVPGLEDADRRLGGQKTAHRLHMAKFEHSWQSTALIGMLRKATLARSDCHFGQAAAANSFSGKALAVNFPGYYIDPGRSLGMQPDHDCTALRRTFTYRALTL